MDLTTHNTWGWFAPAPGGSAYGPRPEFVIPDEGALELVRSCDLSDATAQRKRLALNRWRVMCEQHEGLIRERIAVLQKVADVRKAIAEHVDTTINPARDIIKDVCAVWKHDARRNIAKAGNRGRKAFLRLVEESRFASLARGWNRQAFFVGPVIAIPVIRRERLTFDSLLPHFTEVVADSYDPYGPPVAALWRVEPSRVPCTPGQSPEANAILLDDNSWRYFDLSKATGKSGGEIDVWGQIGDPIEHGLRLFPGSVLRFDELDSASDWWGTNPHQRLYDVTIAVGFIAAVLSYTRKSQSKKLLKAIGDIQGIPTGTTLSAEVPFEAQTEAPDSVQIDAIDFDTNPENFIKHVSWLLQVVARSYGGGLKTRVGAGANLVQAEVEFPHAALTELRNEQIPHARDFERDLWAKAVEMAKRHGHPLADDLPDPDKVREGFEIEFPRLARSFANIEEEQKFWDFRIKNGVSTYGDILREEMPLATDEERDAEVLRRIDRQIPIVERFTKRNLLQDPRARDDASLKTPAQQFGAMGPDARDGKKPPQPEDKPEDEDKETE